MNNLTSPFINEQGVVGVSTPTVLATGKNASYTSSSSVSSLRFSNPS